MTRRYGYSTQTVAEFKKEVYDYWESDIKKDEEDEEKDYDEEAYATYGSKQGYKQDNNKKPEAVENPNSKCRAIGQAIQKEAKWYGQVQVQ